MKKNDMNSSIKDFYTDDLHFKEGLSENFFIHRENISAHIMLSGFPKARILACFPDENSGIALMFDRDIPENNGITLNFSSLPHSSVEGKRRGVVFSVKTDRQKTAAADLFMDSIRFIRSLKYPGGVDGVMKNRKEFLQFAGLPEEGFLYPHFEILMENGRQILKFRRTTPDGRNNFFCDISVDPDETEVKVEEEKVSFVSLKGKEIEFQMSAGMDYAPLTPYMPYEILNEKAANYQECLKTKSREFRSKYEKSLNSLAFLSYREKFPAGSWRFLTYFGRDTMMSLMMLKGCLNTGVYESGMQSVLDRLSPDGVVAHEEDIGCSAIDFHIGEYIRRRNGDREREAGMRDGESGKKGGESGLESPSCRKDGESGLGNSSCTVGMMDGDLLNHLSSPVYDYKMVDDDFMLPLMVDFFTNHEGITHQQKREFLERINGRDERNISSLLRNFNYIIGKTEKYGKTGDPAFLIKINDGIDVGDWRDSGAGLGWGRYPGSINVSMAGNCLEAIRRILESGIYSMEELVEISDTNNLRNLSAILENPEILMNYIESWKKAGRHFEVRLSPEEVRERIINYLKNAPLESGERDLLFSTTVEEDVTIRDFQEGSQIPEMLKTGIQFHALSLDENLKPVEVMNSDSGFSLFFGEPESEEIEEILKTITLPYPLGLALPGGMVAASPVFSHNRHLWKALDENAYHGRVVWAWQMFLMELGLCRQIRRFRKDDKHRKLVKKMSDGLKKLRKMEETAGNLSQSELWTHEVINGELKPVAYGIKNISETESNPVQLWSTVGIAVMMEVDGILGMRGE